MDQRRLAEKTNQEEGELSEVLLNTVCANTQENLKDEKAELELIVSQCNKDISSIGKK